MPTYDYKCEACGHSFEKFQSITAKPVRKCPSCSKMKAKRLIGMGAGIIFKGSGFYQTDYRSSSYQEAAKKDKPADESKSADKVSTESSGDSSKSPAKSDSSKSLPKEKNNDS